MMAVFPHFAFSTVQYAALNVIPKGVWHNSLWCTFLSLDWRGPVCIFSKTYLCGTAFSQNFVWTCPQEDQKKSHFTRPQLRAEVRDSCKWLLWKRIRCIRLVHLKPQFAPSFMKERKIIKEGKMSSNPLRSSGIDCPGAPQTRHLRAFYFFFFFLVYSSYFQNVTVKILFRFVPSFFSFTHMPVLALCSNMTVDVGEGSLSRDSSCLL